MNIQLKESYHLPLSVLSLVLSILSIAASFFSGASFAFMLIAYLFSIPSIILGVLILTQNSYPFSIGIPIASLICNKISWTIIIIFLSIEIVKFLESQAITFLKLFIR